MSKYRLCMSAVISLLVVGFSYAEGKTWYVDAGRPAGTGDGKSLITAFHTIQEAIDNNDTSEGDTILVAKGVYNEGSSVGQSGGKDPYKYSQQTRVVLRKRLTLKSISGCDETHIVGAHGDWTANNDGETGRDGTIAGIWVPTTGKGSIIEGFTIRDAAAYNPSNGGAAVGCAEMASGSDDFVIAYCRIYNCCHNRGAVYGGIAIGTAFYNNIGVTNAGANNMKAVNCIFYNNAPYGLHYAREVVNCTFANNPTERGIHTTSSLNAKWYNSAMLGNGKRGYINYPTCYDCFMDVDSEGDPKVKEGSENVYTFINNSSASLTNMVMSSITGDMRPIAGGFLDGRGKREWLDLDFIPEAYRGRDFYGNKLAADAIIPIGAVLPTAVPMTAGLKVASGIKGLKLNGCRISVERQVHYTDTWPAAVEFSCEEDQLADFIGIYISDYMSSGDGYYKARGKYDSVFITMPPLKDGSGADCKLLTVNDKITAVETLWVDDDADASVAAGTEEAPYRTIQDAVDAAKQSTWTIINLKPGTYKEGGKEDGLGTYARVVVEANKRVVIRGVEGAESTFIEGQPDPDNIDANNPGLGPKAYRCARLYDAGYALFVEVTLRNGYCGLLASNGRASAIYCENTLRHQAYDCVFSESHIHKEQTSPSKIQLQGSCCVSGWMVRCRVKDNVKFNRGFFASTQATACIFENNGVGSGESYGIQDGNTFLSTFYNPKMTCWAWHTSAKSDYCLVASGSRLAASVSSTAANWYGNIIYDSTQATWESSEATYTDPWLSAVERGDYHPVKDSPVLGFADFNVAADRLYIRMRNVCTDFENKPVFASNGKITVGAFSTQRNQKIYVDANNGNNENDGLSEETAIETLAKASQVACRRDTIICLPGIYRTGKVLQSKNFSKESVPLQVYARVVVPSGAELVSRDGAATTIIEGEADSTPLDTMNYGLGPKAVRAVFLNEGAILRGFTIRNGHTSTYDVSVGYNDNMQGGGVLGVVSTGCKAEDCIFENNYADCGGACSYVDLIRCRVVNNSTVRFGPGMRAGSAFDCYFNNNYGDRVCEASFNIIGCTFGYDNYAANRRDGTMSICISPSAATATAKVMNVLAYNAASKNCLFEGVEVRNSIFPKGIVLTDAIIGPSVNQELTSMQLAALYTEGRANALTAPSVDKGCVSDMQSETDLTGVTPRVLNGVVDIGCYEAEWKNHYAANLGGRRVTAVEATAGLREVEDGKVALGDKDSLALQVAANGNNISVIFEVTGGTLTIMRNGETMGEYTSGQRVNIVDAAELENLTFKYSGTGSAVLAQCRVNAGGYLLIR